MIIFYEIFNKYSKQKNAASTIYYKIEEIFFDN